MALDKVVARRRKEQLRYDGRGPCWSGAAAPRTKGRWPLLLVASTSPPLRDSRCSQQVVDKSFKNFTTNPNFPKKGFQEAKFAGWPWRECCRIKRKSKAAGGCSNFLTQSCVGSRPRGTTRRCFENWTHENTQKNAVKIPVVVAPACEPLRCVNVASSGQRPGISMVTPMHHHMT